MSRRPMRRPRIRRTLERDGVGIGMADSLIAGIVAIHHGILLTRNRRHSNGCPGCRWARWAARRGTKIDAPGRSRCLFVTCPGSPSSSRDIDRVIAIQLRIQPRCHRGR